MLFTKCPEASCTEESLVEIGCRIIEQVDDRAGKDK